MIEGRRCPMLHAVLPAWWSTGAGWNAAVTRTIGEAVRELYNPAQRDVLRRIGLLLRSRPDPNPVDAVHLARASAGAGRRVLAGTGKS